MRSRGERGWLSGIRSGAVFEAPAFVAGLDDVAVVGETIKQRGRHFRVAEDAWPFAEGEVGGDDDRGALVEPADEWNSNWPPAWAKGIAEFIEDDEVEASEIVGDSSLSSGATLGLELIDEIDGGVEAPS